MDTETILEFEIEWLVFTDWPYKDHIFTNQISQAIIRVFPLFLELI